jgi:hypothetical protein
VVGLESVAALSARLALARHDSGSRLRRAARARAELKADLLAPWPDRWPPLSDQTSGGMHERESW